MPRPAPGRIPFPRVGALKHTDGTVAGGLFSHSDNDKRCFMISAFSHFSARLGLSANSFATRLRDHKHRRRNHNSDGWSGHAILSVYRYRDPASSGTLASISHSSLLKRTVTAPTFCSRCWIDEVPGIGSVIGDRHSSHASATCVGLAWCAFATL